MATEETKYYNVHEGKHGRTPGIYSDEEDRRRLEDYRARIEGREPDYDNLGIGYSPFTTEPHDNTMSNPAAARQGLEAKPAFIVEREVFSEPNVVVRTGQSSYADRLQAVNEGRAAATPMGAPAGAYDDGGQGGPSFLDDLEGKSDEELQKAAASAVTVKPNEERVTGTSLDYRVEEKPKASTPKASESKASESKSESKSDLPPKRS